MREEDEMRELPIGEDEMVKRVKDGWIEKKKREEGGREEPRSNWAGDIGHPCALYLYGCRAWWTMRSWGGDGVMEAMFDGGKRIEEQSREELKRAGFVVVEDQLRIEDRSLELSGKLDFSIEIDRRRYPADVKGLNHQAWLRMRSVREFLESEKVWLVKYPGQLMAYLWGKGEPLGLLWLKSKLTYEMWPVWIDIEDHVEYMDGVFKKLELVNEGLKIGVPPEPAPYQPWMCDECEFRVKCPNERKMGEPLDLVSDEILVRKLEKREYWEKVKRDAERMFKPLDAEVKAYVNEKRPRIASGGFLVERYMLNRKGYEVKEVVDSPCVRVKRIGGKEEEVED